MQIYVVKENDTVDDIGRAFGTAPRLLAWVNQIEPPYRLAVGQALLIPDGNTLPGIHSSGSGSLGMNLEMNLPGVSSSPMSGGPLIRLGGYAYPWIERDILEEISPFLTGISVFSYGFTEEGELILPEEEGERRILEAAKRHRVVAALVLTPLDSEGRFNNRLVSAAVRDMEAQQRLIRNLWETAQEKGYGEINIDFEYVLAADRELLVAFVRRLRIIMNLFGIRVTVALAPKISADQPGLLYEGIDYRGLGEAANGVFLMTYEWGYTYGPPMAVAPIDKVRQVVDYAVTEIPPAKIILGIPNYGYDWPLPFERGVTAARSLGYTEAVRLAIDHGVPIEYDETAQSPYFHYWQYGIFHEVWFEDIRSIQEKFNLIKEYGLAGGGYWQLMRLFRASWFLAAEEFRIMKAG